MTQAQFKNEWAGLVTKRLPNATKKEAAALVDDLVGYIARTVKKGDKVNIPNLGIFTVSKRNARWGRNPRTGEKIKIKASKKVAFRAAKSFKESAGALAKKGE
jgi:DNA-binding protein HU-beta